MNANLSIRKEIVTNERKWNVHIMSMRKQTCGTPPGKETGRLKNKVSRATYAVNFLFRELLAFRTANLQKTLSSQLSGHEIVLIIIVKILRQSITARNVRNR